MSLLLLVSGNYCFYLMERLIYLLMLLRMGISLLCDSPSLFAYTLYFSV